MEGESSGIIYTSRINFILIGGLASSGVIAGCIDMNIGYLGITLLLLIKLSHPFYKD